MDTLCLPLRYINIHHSDESCTVFVLCIDMLSYLYRFIFTNRTYHHINISTQHQQYIYHNIYLICTNHMIFESYLPPMFEPIFPPTFTSVFATTFNCLFISSTIYHLQIYTNLLMFMHANPQAIF